PPQRRPTAEGSFWSWARPLHWIHARRTRSTSDLGGRFDERGKLLFGSSRRRPDLGFGASENLVLEACLDPGGRLHRDGNRSCKEHSGTLARVLDGRQQS